MVNALKILMLEFGKIQDLYHVSPKNSKKAKFQGFNWQLLSEMPNITM